MAQSLVVATHREQQHHAQRYQHTTQDAAASRERQSAPPQPQPVATALQPAGLRRARGDDVASGRHGPVGGPLRIRWCVCLREVRREYARVSAAVGRRRRRRRRRRWQGCGRVAPVVRQSVVALLPQGGTDAAAITTAQHAPHGGLGAGRGAGERWFVLELGLGLGGVVWCAFEYDCGARPVRASPAPRPCDPVVANPATPASQWLNHPLDPATANGQLGDDWVCVWPSAHTRYPHLLTPPRAPCFRPRVQHPTYSHTTASARCGSATETGDLTVNQGHMQRRCRHPMWKAHRWILPSGAPTHAGECGDTEILVFGLQR